MLRDVLSDWTVTHRSSSSLGNFLLMTASSLLANIWKGAEDSQSRGFITGGSLPSDARLTHESNTELLQSHQQMISCHGVLGSESSPQDKTLYFELMNCAFLWAIFPYFL